MLEPDLEKGEHLSAVAWTDRTESILTETVVDDLGSALPPEPPKTESPDEDFPDEAYPDGGWAAWLTVAGAFLALVCSFGQLTSFGTFQSWYSENQLSGLPPSTISWIGSVQLWVFFFSGGFVGRVFDAHGPRILMVPGTAILVLSVMLTSICRVYYQYILVQGVLFGLGVGMVFYPSLSAISTHFKKYRATALGIALAGSGVGGVVYPIMLRRLFLTCGFGWAVRISGFLCLASCAAACCTVSSRLPTQDAHAPWFDARSFRDARYLLLIAASTFISLGLFIPNFYIVSYALDRGVPADTAFYVLAVLNAGGVAGRVLPACLADVLGRFNVLVPCAFLAGLATLALWTLARAAAPVMLYAAAFGFCAGAFNALVVPCVAQVSGIREIGRRVGMLYSIVSFPSLAGGPAAGALLRLQGGSYEGMIVLSGASVIVGSLFALWARLRIDSRLRAVV